MAGFVLLVGLLFSSLGNLTARTESPPPEALQAAAKKLVALLKDWKIDEIDPKPSVVIDGQQGYRVALEHTWIVYPAGQRQLAASEAPPRDLGPGVRMREACHFVLVPAGSGKLDADFARKIPWKEEESDSKEFRLPVALGRGYGFDWFSYTTIGMQESIRRELALTGGDDRLQLLIKGLSVPDGDTPDSSMRHLAKWGDGALPAIDEAIRTSADTTYPIRSLAVMNTPAAAKRLLELYNSEDPKTHEHAADALTREFVHEAKPAYFDMLRRQTKHTPTAAKTCMILKWKDAGPLLNELVEKPSSFAIYMAAYHARGVLSGHPVDPGLLKAAESVRNTDPAEAQRALERITNFPDSEAAVFVGLRMATLSGKGDLRQVHQAGLEILKALPRPAVQKVLARLAAARTGEEPVHVERVLEELSGDQ